MFFQKTGIIMQSIIKIFSILVTIFLVSCTTRTTDNSTMFAEEGVSKIMVTDLQASKADIHGVLMKILRERGWTILDEGNPVIVEQLNGIQHPKLKIHVYSGKVEIDSAGSLRSGQPYVPLSYMEYIRQSLVKDLRTPEYLRYNQ